MPVYEFDCLECDKSYEISKSITNNDPEFCEVCGAKLNKVYSIGGIIFNGTGWGRDGNND